MLMPEFHVNMEVRFLGLKKYIICLYNAKGIRGTPNVKNLASQRLFEN